MYKALFPFPHCVRPAGDKTFPFKTPKHFPARTLPEDCFLPFSLWTHCKCGFGCLRPFSLAFPSTYLRCSECFLLGTADVLTAPPAAVHSRRLSTALLLGVAPHKMYQQSCSHQPPSIHASNVGLTTLKNRSLLPTCFQPD